MNNEPIETLKQIESKDKAQRISKVTDLLTHSEIPWHRQSYKGGSNYWATLGNAPYIGIGSHYDVVPNSPGANDNASAMAVILDILNKAKQNPLNNIGLKGFFFDEEENGLLGSKAYVEKFGYSDLICLYNMELVGSGDQIALWPVDTSQNTLALKTLEQKATSIGIKTHRFKEIVTNRADHVRFRESGLVDVFTITTITDEDLKTASVYFEAIRKGKSITELQKIISQAPVFKNYHQPTDTSEHLSNNTLTMVSDLLWESIKKIDQEYS